MHLENDGIIEIWPRMEVAKCERSALNDDEDPEGADDGAGPSRATGNDELDEL